MTIIGELINGTREAVRRAISRRDADAIAQLAVRQAEAGAGYLDCNVGMIGAAEDELMAWLVETVSGVVELPLCIDTANPDAMRAGLDACADGSRPICNSISLESARLESFLPIIAERQVRVIGLLMTDAGVPKGVQERVDAAARLVAELEGVGVAHGDIFIDAVVTPLSVDPEGPRVAMEAMREIVSALPDAHTICGVSNVSYGLPQRALLNRVFLSQAIAAGLDSAILDPCDRALMAALHAAEALAGRDEWCANYLQAYRRGVL